MNSRIPLSRIIPMNPDAMGYSRISVSGSQSNTNSNSNSVRTYQPQAYQNVIIGNGMMTVRSNPSSQVPTVFVPVQITPHVQYNQSASILHHPSHSRSQHQWSCGGVIISEVGYNKPSGHKCEAIFLGRNKHGKYELFRGSRDQTDKSPCETAVRESNEESANFFNLSSKSLNESFKVSNSNSSAHFYVVRLNPPKGGIQSKLFSVNRAVLSANHAPPTYFEMDSITRIDINEAISAGITNYMQSDFTMKDVYGNSITIQQFDAKMISRAIQAQHFINAPVQNCKFIHAWNDSYNGGKKNFLNDTCSYKC